MTSACSIRVRGVVQGVGFRPFVYRLARANLLAGWVLNGEKGVQIFVEGSEQSLNDFARDLAEKAPAAACIADLEVIPAEPQGLQGFFIRESERRGHPTVRVSPDLPVCDDCLRELFTASDPRFRYPYINCTNCGPRYTVILGLPYDRANTTMKRWPLDPVCREQYEDPLNRRFHAQPVACHACGPEYLLREKTSVERGSHIFTRAAQMLRDGRIIAIKGLGGYHLACDARNPQAVSALRERKFRKERPFAVMARDPSVVRKVAELGREAEEMLAGIARPIVLAPAKVELPEIAPDNRDIGIMLPYTPVHHLLFAAGAPELLVMTSANRSSEPIAYEDEDALESLGGIADAFLVGERPIARRVDDSVVRVGTFGTTILRRARGYAPAAVTTLPTKRPVLALGADLKNSVTLVVDGQAFVSQHIGDLEHFGALRAFEQTVHDLLAMYEVPLRDVLLVHDAHPQYRSTAHALAMKTASRVAVQHHRAHVASVLAEIGEWDARVAAVSFDGAGFGDDGSIWGGEIFVGSVRSGFERVAHLRTAVLPGGDAAAQYPVQAAAGFLSEIEDLPDLTAPPFGFPSRFRSALELAQKNVRSFSTTSVGRLFDTVAALIGFTREITFEGQAAIWLEQLARRSRSNRVYPMPFVEGKLDFSPILRAVIEDRRKGKDPADSARAFHFGVAEGVAEALRTIGPAAAVDAVVLSGGVFQNELLLEYLKPRLESARLRVLVNHAVPSNDGGISLGQAALAAFAEAP